MRQAVARLRGKRLEAYVPLEAPWGRIAQADCDAIAARLNSRPRKRLGYRTPEECFALW